MFALRASPKRTAYPKKTRARSSGSPHPALANTTYHMKLIAISWPTMFNGEADIINALFEQGLPVLHLRKPGATEAEVEKLVMRIRPEYHDRLTLHYFPDLAERLELGGYHLSAGHAPAPDDWEGRLSASCHTVEELRATLGSVDYAFLSPIFDSISKHGYNAGFTTDDLLAARDSGVIGRRVIALGGITPENIPMAAEMGFGGVAVLGGLWGDLTPEAVMRNYYALINCEVRCHAEAI